MMIECDVKTDQTVESIEHTRREGGNEVGVKIWKMVEGSMFVERMEGTARKDY